MVLDDGEPAIRPDFVWRDQRLTLAGWRVVRVTWRQITRAPANITRLLVGLLATS